ncbi:asparagine synthase (glutamine-hydrolyzing) [Candidatus Uhrbacteria bacterium]|nr:asparagine synthase (glutamine-hydrolyzing) [Candidatus Uhrbacteria bacterium]
MCGISGFNFQDEEKLKAMIAIQNHRGPDDAGTFSAPGISLGHNRLSIIDLSPLGHQPMSYANGRYTITFNGEIYNFQELKEELEKKGHSFKSKSDTEALLAAYAEWGKESIKKLNGIFAFAVWDKERNELFLARDHLGVKPLYYYWDGKKFIFASEIKAILRHNVPREIDLDSLNVYFRFLYVPAPKTIWKNIFKLPAGNFAVLKNGDLKTAPYWELKSGKELGRGEAQEQILALFRDAVKRQLISDRPLGVFLSGGIDSTAVLGAMAEIIPGKIKTFSVGFDIDIQEERYNADFYLAERIAKHFGTDHYSLKISANGTRDCFEKVIYHMDEPVSNHIQPATYLLSQFAKKKVDVVLGGDGGDELFGGYDRYYYNSVIDKIGSLPAPLLNPMLLSFLGNITGRTTFLEKVQAKQGLDRFFSFMAQKEEKVGKFLKKDVSRPEAAARAFAPYFENIEKDFTNQMMMADVKTWLTDESLIRSDKLSMAFALEERVPILDYRLAELAFSIPSKYKLESRILGKKIFRQAIGGLIPDFVAKEKKRGFFSPAAKWIRGELYQFAGEILSPSYTAGTDAYFDFAAISKILDDHKEMRVYGLNTIWALMTFQVWHNLYLKPRT